MLFLVSPAKALDETPAPEQIEKTSLAFGQQAKQLMDELKQLGPVDVAQLMHLSDKLAELNYERFQAWQYPFDDKQSKQAALLFKGDVYQGLEASSLAPKELTYLQTHLRILSGLYGLLKPLDGILPYRLEMGTKFQNAKGKDLYAFWGEQITTLLNQQLAEQDSRMVVNLASNEYFKAVKKKQLNADVITPQFKDWKNGQYKNAKRARGLMARYAAVNQVEQVEDLKYFDYDGYQFAPDLSSEKDWVFTRKQTD
ncbi:MAG: peroxide stress protein YaaA [Thiomicrospira sp.]|nr:MAG: peroxide stress protein YaaA [Thiomicrospira sp.]